LPAKHAFSTLPEIFSGSAVRYRLPSLNALRAFEAAARHESFTKAALDLNVTQGAVSHQVKALEAEIGLKLFRREPQRLMLTDAGRRYLEVVRDAFDRLAAGTEELLRRQSSGVLTVSMSPNFAAKWLVPRLGRFVADHPEIDLRVAASVHHVDFAREDVDLAIRHGEGKWPGLHVVRLCTEELFPVCSPRLPVGPQGLRHPSQLRDYTLLHLDGRDDWQKWLDAAAVEGVDLSHGVVFNQASMTIDAAIDGQGVALSRTALASLDLLAGRLVRPFAEALPAPYAYYVVCPKATANRPKIMTFRDWLLTEAKKDEQRLRELPARAPQK
jgi:LysR family transcriptional regulator, glycine cleavage system transcriptional activator